MPSCFPDTNARRGLAGLGAVLTLAAGHLGATPVVTAEVAEQTIVRVARVTGTVTSPQTAVLSPSVGGLIGRIAVDVGDRVDAGALLVQLDPELDELALEGARARAAEASSALADARRRLAEAERLSSDRSIAETEVESRRTAVAMAEAALQAATADVGQRQAIVRRHAILAPFAGVISERTAEIGEWVNPGDGILALVATDALRFDFRAPQDIYGSVSLATPIRVSLDGQPEAAADARIQAIVPVSDPSARTFLIRAVLVDRDLPGATPGMSARATLQMATGRTAAVVPRDALLRYPDGRITVWVVSGSDDTAKVSERVVETGLEFSGLVEIRSGLAAGARVVTRGNEALQDGQTVELP